MRNNALAVPADRPEENRRIDRSSFVTGAVSGLVAGLLGVDPLTAAAFGGLVGAGAWSWSKAKQAFKS